MNVNEKQQLIRFFDDRRDLAIPGDHQATLNFCMEHFITQAAAAIELKGNFYVALSGGSTPKAVYEGLTTLPYRTAIDWTKVHLFWSDERCVPPYHPESNYHMALEAGFGKLRIPAENIHRIQAEGDVEEGALAYEHLIQAKVPNSQFDLILLGMGDDGHTASLFPKTHALHAKRRLVVANFLPEKNIWRITFTFDCINKAKYADLYVLGKKKADMVKKALTGPYIPDELPVQRVGTREHKSLWILDKEAASLL
jgi:6-phosphogluconolactonase